MAVTWNEEVSKQYYLFFAYRGYVGAFLHHVKYNLNSRELMVAILSGLDSIQLKYCMAAFEYSKYFSELKEDAKKRYEEKRRLLIVQKIHIVIWRARIQ